MRSVLSYLAEPLLSHNYHVLRFNSRGVGGSSGWASLTGFKEVEDLKAVVQWALEKIPGVEFLVILVSIHKSNRRCCLRAWFRVTPMVLW